MTTALIKPPSNAIAVYPDTERYKCRFDIAGSTGSIRRISFDVALGCWVCSCPGNIRWGHCHHLAAIGKRGRKYGKDFESAKLLGVAI